MIETCCWARTVMLNSRADREGRWDRRNKRCLDCPASWDPVPGPGTYPDDNTSISPPTMASSISVLLRYI